MARVADVIVIGLGAMGSAATSYLARSGRRVMAFDRFTPPHSKGSSHGRSRIFRHAYWEDPRYVRMLLRANELWQQLERDSGLKMLHVTGALMMGARNGELVSRGTESARQFGLSHEILSADEVKRRWPVFRMDADSVALLEHNAGYLVPETCVEQQLIQAIRAHAQLHFDEPILEWSAGRGSVTVRTANGTYAAEQLVIASGPWAPQVLAQMNLPLRVTRQVLYWFEPKESMDQFREGRLPVYFFEAGGNDPLVYGFPLTGADSEGVKVAVHGSNELCTPETICRDIRPEDERYIRRRLADTLPSLAGRLLRAETCLYTMTPDENFILGMHPHHPAVTVAAGFSGHGFKFAPVIGEILGELVVGGKSSYDIGMFSPTRFGASPN